MKKWFIGLNEKIRKIIVIILLAISLVTGYLGIHSNIWSWIWALVTIVTIVLWLWHRKVKLQKKLEFDVDKFIKLEEKRLAKMDQNAPLTIVESNEKDVEYAYKLINLAANKYDEGNKFGYLCILNGIGISRVGVNLDMPHNHRAVVDAVHRYQKDNLDRPIMEGYMWAIGKSIDSIAGAQAVDRIIDILNYELMIQKSGQASLPIDFEPVIIKLNALEETNEKEHLYDESRKKQISDFKQSTEEFQKSKL